MRFLMVGILFFMSSAVYAATFWGEKVPLGRAYARSFVVTEAKGGISEMGIVFSPEALNGLPAEEREYVLKLPAEAHTEEFSHIGVNWNPHGHEPMGVYDVPHFDFHFYLISEKSRRAISCQGEDVAICMKQPDQSLIPPNYAPTPAGVPMMGWHWVDTTAPEFNGRPFTATMIYGYYNGQIAFVEPMVTLDFLRNQRNFSASFPKPAVFPGFIPSMWSTGFDAARNLYVVRLSRYVL